MRVINWVIGSGVVSGLGFGLVSGLTLLFVTRANVIHSGVGPSDVCTQYGVHFYLYLFICFFSQPIQQDCHIKIL